MKLWQKKKIISIFQLKYIISSSPFEFAHHQKWIIINTFFAGNLIQKLTFTGDLMIKKRLTAAG